MSVTRAAFDAAVRAAKRAGVPQPVKDDKGNVAYYVDQTGATVDQPATTAPPRYQTVGSPVDRNTTPESSFGQLPGGGGLKATAAQQASVTADERSKAATQSAVQAKAAQAVVDQLAARNSTYAWVDGKRVTVVGFDQNGVPLYTLDHRGDPAKKVDPNNPLASAYSYKAPTAYGALDAGTLPDQNGQFLFSMGPQIDPSTGQTLSAIDARQAAGGSFDTPLQAQAAQRRINDAVGANRMTIQGALQWLANLSTRDPQAYGVMVDRLHKAGYLNDSAYATAGGGYNSEVGLALARAGADLAVINTTPDGRTIDLNAFLDQRAGANANLAAQARAAQYRPVDRKFTDPADLVAAARNDAMNTLGRQLTPQEEQQLTSHFHSLESSAYDQIDAAGRSGNAATVTPPSATGQVDAFVHSDANAQEAANYSVAKYGSVLRNLFGLPG